MYKRQPHENTKPKKNWGYLVNLFESGYNTINGKEIIAKIKLLKGSKNRIKHENINITVNPINASFIDTSPLAIGLFFVLSTLASISLSHKSFTTQPAPLIKIAPIVNRRINFKECIIEID